MDITNYIKIAFSYGLYIIDVKIGSYFNCEKCEKVFYLKELYEKIWFNIEDELLVTECCTEHVREPKHRYGN